MTERGRPERAKRLAQYADGRSLVSDGLTWTPRTGDDAAAVVVGAIQHRLLRAVAERSDDPAALLSELLALGPRNVPALMSGEKALDSEQIARLLLGMDLGWDALHEAPSMVGAAGLLPEPFRPWLVRDVSSGRVSLREPPRTIEWAAVARDVAAPSHLQHLHDDGALLVNAVAALAEHGGPPADVVERVPAKGSARAVYHGREPLILSAHLLTAGPSRDGGTGLVRVLAAPSTSDIVAVALFSRRSRQALDDLCPPLAGLTAGIEAELTEADLGPAGVPLQSGALTTVRVECLAHNASVVDREALVLRAGKRSET